MRPIDATEPRPAAPAWSDAELVELTLRLANDPTPASPPAPGWAVPLLVAPDVEAWLLGWPAGLVTTAHDHGHATVAVTVVEGMLSEECLDPTIWTTGRRTTWRAGASTLFPRGHVHVLGAAGDGPAVAVHAWGLPAGSAGRGAGRLAPGHPEASQDALVGTAAAVRAQTAATGEARNRTIRLWGPLTTTRPTSRAWGCTSMQETAAGSLHSPTAAALGS